MSGTAIFVAADFAAVVVAAVVVVAVAVVVVVAFVLVTPSLAALGGWLLLLMLTPKFSVSS